MPMMPTDRNDWNIRTLRKFNDEKFRARDKALAEPVPVRDTALNVALTELNRRLDLLNNAHEDMRTRDLMFFTRNEHQLYISQVQERFETVQDQIAEITRPNYMFMLTAITAAFSFMAGVYYVVVVPIQKDLDVRSAVQAERVKGVEIRIDDLQKEVLRHETADTAIIKDLHTDIIKELQNFSKDRK